MRKYYTRPCNFYYGNYAKRLIKTKKALSLTGNLSIENLGSTLTNVSSVTNIYKNVMAGNITGVTQISSLAQKFGIMRPSSLPANLGWAPTYLQKFTNIKSSIGGFVSSGISAIRGFFS